MSKAFNVRAVALFASLLAAAALLPGQVFSQARPDGESRPAFLSKDARVTIHPVTKVPQKIVDMNAVPSKVREGRQVLNRESAEAVFRDFLAENRDYLKVPPEEVKLVSATQRRGTWYVKFQQFYKGIPVHDATVGFTATDKGMIRSYGSSFQPRLDVDTTPKIGLPQAVETARRTYDPKVASGLKENKAFLVIYPHPTAPAKYTLAWSFELKPERPDPEVEKQFIVDAASGKILKSYPLRFPGAKAEGREQGEVYPVNPTAPPVATVALADAYVTACGNPATTDANGDFSVSVPWWCAFYVAEFKLEGPYARVQDCSGNNYVTDRSCYVAGACDFTWTATDRDHINLFYHINAMHGWYKAHVNHDWVNAWTGSPRFNAQVNCAFNNAYSGDPMQFGTDNYARSSDVIYHECTHNVLYAQFGNWIGFPDTMEERYAFDEGFSDYFAGAMTEDPRHGEGYGGTRTLSNTAQYVGKAAYSSDGHTGGTIIAGAAWDLRQRLMTRLGNVNGALYADRLVFEALQQMATMPRDYYFSDPQESNFLSSLYIAADDNNNLMDGVPYFLDMQRAFANHNLLQAVLKSTDSYDVSTNTVATLTGGDFYFSQGQFWANNSGQRGVVDLGDIGTTALDQVAIPSTGYTRFGVAAAVNHTYVSLAQQGEGLAYIVFRVLSLNAAGTETAIQYLYRRPLFIEPVDLCDRVPRFCERVLDCKKYPFLCRPYEVLPGRNALKVKFRHELDRIVVPVSDICLYVINCPGCAAGALCADFAMRFTGMPDAFGMAVYDADGREIVKDVTDRRSKTIRFKPDGKERYFLVLHPGKRTKPGVDYTVPVAVSGR